MPGKFPTVVKQVTEIATPSEKVVPIKLKTVAQIKIVSDARKKKLKMRPTI